MSPDDARLMRLAAAIADGTDVDWAEAESSASAPEWQQVVRQLRVVAGLAAVHRSAPASVTTSQPDPITQSGQRTWGPLELRQEIGKGHFGTVYRAWDHTLEREVAVKILLESDWSAAVVQEGRLLARVRHPNVVTVYGVDQFDGTVGLWMEFVGGLTLKQVLLERGVFGAHEAALIGIDLCRALAAVHKAGLLHRDIKTQNVMREAGGRIVLMDFGAGEVRSEHSMPFRRLTGTPLYLAPEVLVGGTASVASDIYSVGVLLYHLVTLRYPVEGESVADLAAAHARGQLTPVTEVRPDLPAGFAQVIGTALDHDPARRHRSAGAMHHDLVNALALDVSRAESDTGGASVAVGDQPVPATQSIAVLPFVSLGPDQDIEYFCNGLAEELLMALGKVKGLRVASRTSSFHFTQTATDIRGICRQLDVDAVLEGTVRKAGDRLRITAQLVSGTDGCHLWSEGYDRKIADVFAVQEEIAQSVVDRFKIRATESSGRPLIRRYTDNPRAYHLYLKGRFYWSQRYQGGLKTALEYFLKAFEEDAGYALPYAGLADAYAFLGFYCLQKPRVAFAAAAAAVDRALAIDPLLPEAHTSRALMKLGGDWDWREAEREFRRALELDPTQVLARVYYSWLLVLMGDPATALIQARIAQDMEPLSPLVNGGVAFTLYLARRYDQGVEECEQCLEIDPNFIIATYVMAMCRAQQARLSEAVQLMEKAASLSGRAPFYLGLLGNFYARNGSVDQAREVIRELEEAASKTYVPPHSFAYIHAGLGDLDRAFEWQARAYDDGAPPFNYFSPVIESLQQDPRHQAELQRMGLRA